MKKPCERATRIDTTRIRKWLSDFASYRHSITDNNIRDWLAQFDPDQDVAARLLDCVDFYTHEKISVAFRNCLGGLPGWHLAESKRKGKWRFAAYSSSAGESGDAMLRKFRHANGLSAKGYKDLFIHRSQIPLQKLGPDDTLVMIDDFVGTGDQVCETWQDQFAELVADVGNLYLIVVAAIGDAVGRVSEETDISLIAHSELGDRDNLFHAACAHFTDEEKAILLKYCEQASGTRPQGFGDCGLVVVFADSCPNNTIPVLHATSKKWEGLFRRYD